MENASKALIIAGAILISILLISVGVLIMNSTGDTAGTVDKQGQVMATRTFNSQFTAYEGESVSGSQIKALISAINASNAKDDDHQITIKSGTNQITKSSQVTQSKKYKVEIDYHEGQTDYDGYIKEISITAST